MNKQEQNKLAAESIERAIESIKDGIVVEFHDHLSMDAFRVYVRKDGQTVKIDTKYRYRWSDEQKREVVIEDKLEGAASESIEVCMMTSSSYYGTVGLSDMLRRLSKKYDVPAYFLSIGWYTFPSAYLNASDYIDCIRRHGNSIELYECDFTITDLKKLESAD